MKLGFVSAIFPDLSLEEVLAVAAAQGFSVVELMAWPVGKAERKYAGVTHVEAVNFTKARAEDVLTLARKHGVAISALGYYPNVLDPNEAVARPSAAHLKKVIAAAAMLGLTIVNTFIGRDWTKSVDENWPRLLKVWRPLIQFAEDHDVRLGIENCPMLFSRDEWPGGKNIAVSPAIWRRLFNDLASPNLGLNYDPSHFAFQFMDPIAPLREFRDKLFHLHAKDVEIHLDRLNDSGLFACPAPWHQARIPGYGDIDWARFMAELTAAGYDGPVCIEVEDDTFGKTLAGRQRALQVARNVLNPFFPI
ncbi:MAG TPA: sugar phosphate isomerase/epimerase [Candidatus Saccharimonadales bacterium]|nr:sugar phosphate isomerase/epimerase [Candidatus Saccharimonadales bacterium]